MLTGLGGQGVQLTAKTLATAGVHDGLEVMMFSSYTGAMRGGSTEATVVLSSEPVRTPPTVRAVRYAIGMHHKYWPAVGERIRPDGLAVIDSDVFRGDPGARGWAVDLVDANTLATEAGAPRAAAMVALGRLAAATGLVTLASLERAAHEVLPPYRAQFAAANAAAIRSGFTSAPQLARLANTYLKE